MRIQAKVEGKDKEGRVLLTDVKYLAGVFRDHCWVKARYTEELRKIKKGTTITMDAKSYRYEDKLSLCSITNIKELCMECIPSNVTVTKKAESVMIKLTIPTKYRLQDIEMEIEDGLEQLRELPTVVNTNSIAVNRVITVVIEATDSTTAAGIKKLYKDNLTDNFCNAIELLSFSGTPKSETKAETVVVRIKLPKNLAKCFNFNTNIHGIDFNVNSNYSMLFKRSDLGLDGRQIKVKKIVTEDDTYYEYEGKEGIRQLPTDIAKEVITKKIGTYNTSEVLDMNKVIAFKDDVVVTKIKDRELTIRLETIKLHNEVITVEELGDGMFYNILDDTKTPIPHEILNVRTHTETTK